MHIYILYWDRISGTISDHHLYIYYGIYPSCTIIHLILTVNVLYIHSIFIDCYLHFNDREVAVNEYAGYGQWINSQTEMFCDGGL